MKILVFGGNGFIGGECVRYLLDQNKNYEITVAQRGHWPWDSALRIKPHVKHIYCDRLNSDTFGHLESELSENRYQVVIDFTATSKNRVENIYPQLKGRVDLHIYISSDSVYEVCDNVKGNFSSKESDAVRPSDLNLRRELAEADPYGDGKLEVEEFLKNQQAEHDGIPYIFLRLPDVLGPRDTTDRWWKYQMWFQYQNDLQLPVTLPKFLANFQTSYVNTRHVGEVLNRFITKFQKFPILLNEVYNVAYDEPLSLYDILKIIRKESECEKNGKIEIVDGDSNNFKFPAVLESATGALKIGGDFYFPSVARGPIDNSKIKSALQWEPKKIENSGLDKIAKFYNEAYTKFPEEKKMVATSLLEDLKDKVTESGKNKFFKSLSLEEL